jgi:membrane-bound ClpP family serine protease
MLEKIYLYIAIAATMIFVIQLILTVFGLTHDADISHVDASHHDSSHGMGNFPLISVRGVVGFFAMFGWIGKAMLNAGCSKPVTLLVSVLIGVATNFIVSTFMFLMARMASQGNMDLNNAIGKTGNVYIEIPKGGIGKVMVIFQGEKQEVKAKTSGEGLMPGSSIKVTAVQDGVLIVEKV